MRIVVPKIVHASIKRPLLTKYGPMMTRACTASNVGVFMNDPSRSACIAAATGTPVIGMQANQILTKKTASKAANGAAQGEDGNEDRGSEAAEAQDLEPEGEEEHGLPGQ